MSKPVYLIDANLPRWFSAWSTSDFLFAHDFIPTATDRELWEQACAGGLVIVTKDADFRTLALAKISAPKIVHIRFGNMKINQFFTTMSARWPEVVTLLAQHRLIEVWPDRVIAVS